MGNRGVDCKWGTGREKQIGIWSGELERRNSENSTHCDGDVRGNANLVGGGGSKLKAHGEVCERGTRGGDNTQ